MRSKIVGTRTRQPHPQGILFANLLFLPTINCFENHGGKGLGNEVGVRTPSDLEQGGDFLGRKIYAVPEWSWIRECWNWDATALKLHEKLFTIPTSNDTAEALKFPKIVIFKSYMINLTWSFSINSLNLSKILKSVKIPKEVINWKLYLWGFENHIRSIIVMFSLVFCWAESGVFSLKNYIISDFLIGPWE